MNPKLEPIIDYVVKQSDGTLPPDDAIRVGNSLADFVQKATEKYCEGAIEHNDSSILDIDHITAIEEEIIDLVHYLAAMKAKRHLAAKNIVTEVIFYLGHVPGLVIDSKDLPVIKEQLIRRITRHL